MVLEGNPPVKRRRLGAHGLTFRRRRIFAWLREGFTYDEIAGKEGVSSARIRQIVSKELRKRAVDSGAEHAKLQLDRLAPAIQLGADAIATGDISAISPYLRALDRLDRYQTAAVAHQGYDEEDRRKLMEKINRVAANLGVDEMWNAAFQYLRKHGVLPAHPDELRQAQEPEADLVGSPDASEEPVAPGASPAEAPAESGFFYLNRP